MQIINIREFIIESSISDYSIPYKEVSKAYMNDLFDDLEDDSKIDKLYEIINIIKKSSKLGFTYVEDSLKVDENIFLTFRSHLDFSNEILKFIKTL